MTNKNMQSISVLLDEELSSQECKTTIDEMSASDKATFSRYGLIGDVMRNEQNIELSTSFADKIHSEIANMPAHQAQSDVVSISSHPSWFARMASKTKQMAQSTVGKGSAQLAMAASVAFVAVLGVHNMPNQDANTAPILSTVPLVDGIAPVSLSADGPKARPTANQMTQTRINALIADHQQQTRVADTSKEAEQEEEQQP